MTYVLYIRGIIWAIFIVFYSLNVLFISWFKLSAYLYNVLVWAVQAYNFVDTTVVNLLDFLILEPYGMYKMYNMFCCHQNR